MPEPIQHPAMLPYALAYARRGWPVFPLHTPTKGGGCSCGKPCGNPGKHPRTKTGFKQATTDEATIRAWWNQWPDANVGIATGQKSNLLVVDVDPKNGGAGTWNRLQLEHDLESLTVTVDTGSGGWHLYYDRPATPAPIKSKANAIKPGIDTRCDGGYVVAPPSLHVSGARYAFRDGADPGDSDVQPCPQWLLELLYPAPAQPIKPKPTANSADDGWLLTAFKAAGLHLRSLAPDRDAVRCPWAHEHTGKQGDNDSSTVVFRPSATRTMGHFHCSHAHCCDRTIADVRAALPTHAVDAANVAYPAKRKDDPKLNDDPDWQADLIRKPNNHELEPCISNVVSILTHDDQWRGVLAYDEFAGRTIFRRDPPWYSEDAPATPHEQIDDTDDVRLTSWMHRRYSLKIGSSTAHDAIDVVAQRNGYHPVKSYLLDLRWDGQRRLPTFAQVYLGAPADAHYQAAPLRWFVAAVRRVFEPGCQSDSILVFEGGQGIGKSRCLRTLFSDPWFADEIGDPNNKDAADALRGKWGIEIGELRWKKSDEDTRKAFITRRIDHYRPAYGRRAIDVPRQCVLAASTNESSWQTDSTGARRYWVVACLQIDQDAIERDRDQLWAEALALYESGAPSWLQDDEIPEQRRALEERREQDPWEDRIAPWLTLQTEVSIPDVLTQCMDIEPNRQTLGESRRAARILRALGWEQTARRGSRGGRVKIWTPKGSTPTE